MPRQVSIVFMPRIAAGTLGLLLGQAWSPAARAQETPVQSQAALPDPEAFSTSWASTVAAARASQPEWSSPVVTSTALLEQRVRFDVAFQHAGNNSDTVNLDGGKGINLIISGTKEIQIGVDPYIVRHGPTPKNDFTGFGDWPFLRVKQRLASAPKGSGDYVLSAWLLVQAPTGQSTITNHSFTFLPTIGFGKGFGPIVIQGTVGATIPVTHETTTGSQVTTNFALQYHTLRYLWPQLEVNWTYFPDGQTRAGKSQVFLTPGLVVGRFPLSDRLKLTVGIGHQVAVAPAYRAKPVMLPAYNRAWIITTRVGF